MGHQIIATIIVYQLINPAMSVLCKEGIAAVKAYPVNSGDLHT